MPPPAGRPGSLGLATVAVSCAQAEAAPRAPAASTTAAAPSPATCERAGGVPSSCTIPSDSSPRTPFPVEPGGVCQAQWQFERWDTRGEHARERTLSACEFVADVNEQGSS